MTQASTMKARNPRTGQQDYEFEVADGAAVAAAASRLRAEQPQWEAAGLEARLTVMNRFGEAVVRHREELVDALVADTGRYRIATVEVNAIAGILARSSHDARRLLEGQSDWPTFFPGIVANAQWVPFQLVGVISPWNFPVILSMIDSLPALIAGAAVLLKPSEVTPRFVDPLRKVLREVPELGRVFDIVRGPGTTGATLVEHVDAVAFTGSVRTGRIVGEAAAKRFIPAYLELGGKDPAVVLPSAAVAETASVLLRASVAATGQACQSLERIYVHRSMHDALVRELASQARRVEFNYPDVRRGQIGPLIFEKQAATIQSHIDDAVAKGAKIEAGGKVIELGGGLYYPATVLSGVDHSMKVMTEETFGPVLPVMAYDTIDEAVRLANDSIYGLSASVFAADADEAEAVAKRLNGGAVSINDGSLTAMVHEVEHDAFCQSGLGRSRMGPSGVARYMRRKAILKNLGRAADLAAYSESAPG
jgi:acyl-CoA reductase-like NAD-dependent aldehyde dehydrogenase